MKPKKLNVPFNTTYVELSELKKKLVHFIEQTTETIHYLNRFSC